jgi:hypothetical protein
MYGCWDVSNATTTTPQNSVSLLEMAAIPCPLIVIIPINVIAMIFFIFFHLLKIQIEFIKKRLVINNLN